MLLDETVHALTSFGSTRKIMVKGRQWATAGWVHNRGRIIKGKQKQFNQEWVPSANDKHLLILALYAKGLGFREVARQLGIKAQAARAVIDEFGLFTDENKAKRSSIRVARGSGYLRKFKSDFIDHRRNEAKYNRMYWSYYKVAKKNPMDSYYANHEKSKARSRAAAKIRHKNGRKHKTNYYLSQILRSRVRGVLIGRKKMKHTLDMLGASMEKVRAHLEAQFKEGMTWDNYGLHGWHIDHIRPCASFDLSKLGEQRKCFHYTNLQPMWASENIRKGATWNGKQHRHPRGVSTKAIKK